MVRSVSVSAYQSCLDRCCIEHRDYMKIVGFNYVETNHLKIKKKDAVMNFDTKLQLQVSNSVYC